MNWWALVLPSAFGLAAFAFTEGGFWRRLGNAALAYFLTLSVIAVLACLS